MSFLFKLNEVLEDMLEFIFVDLFPLTFLVSVFLVLVFIILMYILGG